MEYFPVTHSNLSASHLGLFLQDKYSFGPDAKCNLIRAGINHTYLLVDNDTKYVCRVYSLNWRTRIEITEELKLLNQLKENNISISYPIADQESNYIQVIHAPEGDRFAVVFSYAEGEKVHNYSENAHFKIGQLMARFHQITEGERLNRATYTPDVLLIDSLQQIEKFLSPDTDEMAFMKSAQQYLLEEFAKINKQGVRHGIVHLDIWFENLNITTEDAVTLFDFDFCGNGLLCLDIAFYVMQVHNIEKYDAKEYQPKIDSFLKGYESVIKISEEEKRIIPMLGISLYFFYLGVQCQRYDNWSNSFLSENYLKRYINGLVKRYSDIYQIANKKPPI